MPNFKLNTIEHGTYYINNVTYKINPFDLD